MPTLVSAVELLKELGFYAVVIPFILITSITYGVLSKIEVLGDNKQVNLIVSIMLGLMIISFTNVIEIISLFTVYMLLIFSVIFFLLILFLFMGVEMKDIANVAKRSEFYVTIFASVIIIGIIVIAGSVPEIKEATDPTTGEPIAPTYIDSIQEGNLILPDGTTGQKSVTQTGLEAVFNPSILAVIVMLLIFAGATLMVGRTHKES